jgi:cytochrome c
MKEAKMNRFRAWMLTALAASTMSSAQAADGDSARGQRLFGACAACHSLEPNRSMTGPSLAGLWNRKAGTIATFPRYSPALKSANIVWDDKTLDEWIKDPQDLIPGNTMTFPGIPNAQQRADLLAFLKGATQLGRAPSMARREGQMGGMIGMGGGAPPNLKKLEAEDRVQAINHCGDTYKVTTADGKPAISGSTICASKPTSAKRGRRKERPRLLAPG